jgi:hypothetical protein
LRLLLARYAWPRTHATTTLYTSDRNTAANPTAQSNPDARITNADPATDDPSHTKTNCGYQTNCGYHTNTL